MVYYSGLLVYIVVLYAVSKQLKEPKTGRMLFFVLTCLGVVLFQGFRSFSVGTDLPRYLMGFLATGRSDFSQLIYQNYETGYVILNKVLYRTGLDERGFLIAIAAIIQIPIFVTMYRYSDFPLLSVLYYFSFGNFMMTFSGLRQSIAMAICFAAYVFIKKKRPVWFILTVLVASAFHSTSLFCLVLYPVYHITLGKKMLFFCLALTGLVFVLRDRVFALITTYYYGEARSVTATGAYTMFIVYTVLFVLSFFGQASDKILDKDYAGLRNILLVLALIHSLASVHNFITRVGFPLTLYMTIYIPKLVDSYIVTPKKVYRCVCCLICIVCFYLTIGTLKTLPFSFG